MGLLNTKILALSFASLFVLTACARGGATGIAGDDAGGDPFIEGGSGPGAGMVGSSVLGTAHPTRAPTGVRPKTNAGWSHPARRAATGRSTRPASSATTATVFRATDARASARSSRTSHAPRRTSRASRRSCVATGSLHQARLATTATPCPVMVARASAIWWSPAMFADRQVRRARGCTSAATGRWTPTRAAMTTTPFRATVATPGAASNSGSSAAARPACARRRFAAT
jgi:hypothetical protein